MSLGSSVQRSVALFTLSAFVAVLAAVPAAADPGTVQAPKSPEAAASEQARENGEDIVVEALTTPTELVVATPDGSLQKTLSSMPVRMQSVGSGKPSLLTCPPALVLMAPSCGPK